MSEIGVNQGPHGGTWYPFTADGPLDQFVLDAYLALPPSYHGLEFPVTLTITGMVGAFTATWANSSGTLFTAPLSAGTVRTWGDRHVVIWVNTTDRILASLVIRNADFATGTHELDPRTIYVAPESVRFVKTGPYSLDKRIVLQAGHNVRLEVEQPDPEALRRQFRVFIHGEPGAGDGRVPGCEDPELAIRFINGVGPDETGRFQLMGEECTRVQRPVFLDTDPVPDAVPFPATLQITDECQTCYPCDAFVRVYQGIRLLDKRYRRLAGRSEYVRDLHRQNIDRWNKEKQCRESKTLRVILTPQEERNFTIAVSWCNNLSCCVEDFEIWITLQLFSGDTDVSLNPAWKGLQKKSLVRGSFTKGEEIPFDPVWHSATRVYALARYRIPYASPLDITTIRLLWMLHGPNLPDLALRAWATVHIADGDCAPDSSITPPDELVTIWNAFFPAWTTKPPIRYLAYSTKPVDSSRGRFFR